MRVGILLHQLFNPVTQNVFSCTSFHFPEHIQTVTCQSTEVQSTETQSTETQSTEAQSTETQSTESVLTP